MELILASAVGAVICYIYTNSSDKDDAKTHKSKSAESRTTQNTIMTKHSAKKTVFQESTNEEQCVEKRSVFKPSMRVKEKSIEKKPDYSMQLINNMLDQMLENEAH